MTISSTDRSYPADVARWAATARSQTTTFWTVERAAYLALALVALSARVWGLGRFPLTTSEADTALAAWRTLQGQGWRPASYVPLLYDAQLVLFFLTKTSDFAVRLLPALVGSALVALPYLVRDLLGRRGALAASVLLALAPTWLNASRLADGAILGVFFGAAALACGYRYLQDDRPLYLRLGIVAAALGLTSGVGFYTLCVVCVVGLVAPRLRRNRQPVDGPTVPQRMAASLTGRDGLVFLGVLLFVASGFLANPRGIGAAANLAGDWTRQLSPASSGLDAWAPFRSLLSYEFLTVALALVSVVVGLRQRERIDLLLLGWFLVTVVLAVPLGHRQPIWLPDMLLPLVILAGRGFERLWDALFADAVPRDSASCAIALVICVFALLEVANYVHTGQDKFLGYARIGIGMLIVLWGAYWYWISSPGAWRALACTVLVLLSSLTIRASVAIGYQTARDPREGLTYQPTSVQVLDLANEVASISSRQSVDPHLLEIDYERSLDPILGWYLRDMTDVRVVGDIDVVPTRDVLITSVRPEELWPSDYIAQRFRLQESYPAQQLSMRENLRWILYRDPVGVEQASEVQLWVRMAAD